MKESARSFLLMCCDPVIGLQFVDECYYCKVLVNPMVNAGLVNAFDFNINIIDTDLVMS